MGTRLAPLTVAVAMLGVSVTPAESAPNAPPATAVISASSAVPKCPARYRPVRRIARGWYACYRKQARQRWVRPTGCRKGYSLWVRRRAGKRAWQCRPRATRPPSMPAPQPSPRPPSGVTNQQLINVAWNAAWADGNADIAETQYLYRGRVTNAWVNGLPDANGNVVSPIYTPYTWAAGLYWPEGCVIESPGVARCTLAEAVYNGPDSSLPASWTANRWYWYAEYVDGRISTRTRSADWPNTIWFYFCFGPPAMSGVPTCY